MQQPRIIDLFSGCGGFSYGAHAAGLPPIAAFDIDPILTSSFASNYPRTKLHLADLSRAEGADLERHAGGRVDGIFGGPPCQAFSDMGHRRVDDPRRSLLGHFFRLVAETRPTFFVMENVKGLGYADTKPVLDAGLALLPGTYKIVGPITLDAAEFGAATKRSRLFVIGYDPERMEDVAVADINSLKAPPTTVRDAIAELSSVTEVGDQDGFDVWKILQKGRPSRYARDLRSADRTFTGHKQTNHTAAVVARFQAVLPGEIDPVGRHPRLKWDGQCPTLRAGTGNDRGSYQSVRPIHPDENRVITVREAARLQGFPDAFRFHPTIWHSFRMIGNSVSPVIAKAIFSLIAKRMQVPVVYPEAAE